MTTPEIPEVGGDLKFRSQYRALAEAFTENRESEGGEQVRPAVAYNDEGAPIAVFQDGRLLVTGEDAARDDAFTEVTTRFPQARPMTSGREAAMLVHLGEGVELAEGGVRRRLKDDVRDLLRPGRISLNHIVSIAPTGTCPADEPRPTLLPPNPSLEPDSKVGEGVKVLIVDTGLIPSVVDAHPWLAGVIPLGGPKQTFEQKPADVPELKEYAGHGTFVAGVLRMVAPGATVHVSNALEYAGATTEYDLFQKLMAVLDAEGWPHIINLSAGTCTLMNQELMGIRPFVERLQDHPGTLLVAAAGNHGNTIPFWPAALAGPFPTPVAGVLSVGALRRDGNEIACFSNRGAWVNVYAPGELLVNGFISGVHYRYRDPVLRHCRYHPSPVPDPLCTCVTAPGEPADTFFTTGRATWSGTSFSTPMVAGMVAARMWRTGEPSRTAAAALLAGADSRPCLGRVLTPSTWAATPLDAQEWWTLPVAGSGSAASSGEGGVR